MESILSILNEMHPLLDSVWDLGGWWLIAGWLAAEWFLGYTALSNRPLFLGAIFLMIMGIQLISMGLLGEMISKGHRSGDEYQIRDFIR